MISVTADELPRVMQCIGSIDMQAVPIDHINDNQARQEGTAAHEMAKKLFDGAAPDSLINQKASNGVIMTAEMFDHVSEYLSALDCGEMEVETSFWGNVWQIRGRADHIKYYPKWDGQIRPGNLCYANSTLTVDDFKYGWRPVEPEMNWTMIAHAIGYCTRHGVKPDEIVLRIHQPRPYHPNGKLREWRISYDQLNALYQELHNHLTQPARQLVTGPACFKCSAYHTCAAALLMENNAIDATYATAFADDLPPDLLASKLNILKHASDVITSRLAAIEELAAHKIKNGAVVPGYGVETKYGNTTWKKHVDAKLLKAMTGIDCEKPAMITPSEFKRRGGSEPTLAALTYRPLTGTKLVRRDATKQARKLLNK